MTPRNNHAIIQTAVRRMAGILALVAILSVTLLASFPELSSAQTGPDQPPKLVTPPPPLDPPVTGPRLNRLLKTTDQSRYRSGLQAANFNPQHRLSIGDAARPTAAQADKGQPAPAFRGIQQNAQLAQQRNALATTGWNLVAEETFDDPGFGNGVSCDVQQNNTWNIIHFNGSGLDQYWGRDTSKTYSGAGAAWPAIGGAYGVSPGGNYPNDMETWMICGPFDFSNAADIYVDFMLWLDIEFDYDFVYFGVSVDNITYDYYYWTGNSDNEWLYEAFFLENYAGYNQVWLSWIFLSDDSNPEVYTGAWLDEISVYTTTGEFLDVDGILIKNGNIENGFTYWGTDPSSPSSISLSTNTYAEGQQSVKLAADGDADDFLYQEVTIPGGINDVELNFWFSIATLEPDQDVDYFCISLSDINTYDLVADLGCLDATYATGEWQEVVYSFAPDEVANVKNKTLELVFELYNRGGSGSGTTAWVDAVQLYASDFDDADYDLIDSNEPNDDAAALPAAIDCQVQTTHLLTGTIGNALEGYGDLDWFKIDNVPAGRLVIDIDAETKAPASELDSVLTLFDASRTTELEFNDDSYTNQGQTYDSYISHTVTTPGSTFYALVESIDGYGGPEFFYNLNVRCNDTGSSPPPPPTPTTGKPDTWTIMLYLNAEDPKFEQTLLQYKTEMEQVLAGKTDFMTVTMLYDGPITSTVVSETVRYLLQPTGNYTPGVNEWPLGEQNVGDRDTLAKFVKWSMDNYPAEHYYLAIDDHGDGAYGISWDRTNGNDSLTPPEVFAALKDATENGVRKIDMIDYEACLMGMAEHAYDVGQWVDYVVFFEQISWSLNTYPNYFKNLQPADTPVQVGTKIVDTYFDLGTQAQRPHTISLIDTGNMSQVKQAMTLLGDALSQSNAGDAARRQAVKTARSKSQAFAAADDATNPALADYIDLWSLADKAARDSLINPTLEQQVKNAVEMAVVAEKQASGKVGSFTWNHNDAHGLAVFYPAVNSSKAFADYTNNRSFRITEDGGGVAGRWDEFLKWAVTEKGNGVSNGIGANSDDRKGMNGARFLRPKPDDGSQSTVDKFVYLPLILK